MSNENDIILSPEETAFITMFRAMDEADQTRVVKIMDDYSKGKLTLEEMSEILNKRD